MTATFRDEDGTARLTGELLIGGTAGDVATVQADGTIAPAAGGSQPVFVESPLIPLTSAQIQALAGNPVPGTPVEMVAAPDPDEILIPICGVVYMEFGSAAYDFASPSLVTFGFIWEGDDPNTAESYIVDSSTSTLTFWNSAEDAATLLYREPLGINLTTARGFGRALQFAARAIADPALSQGDSTATAQVLYWKWSES